MAMAPSESEALFETVNRLVGSVPSFLRGGLSNSTILNFLGAVPPAFKRYTLQELIDTLEDGARNGKIRL